MDVTVVGCGYVGLVTATCLASIGHTVRGVEKDQKKLKVLKDGHCPIFEPGLQELMQEHYAAGSLQFTDNVKAATQDAEVVFLAVGTPPKPDGTVDMSYLEGAGKEVCDALAENNNDYLVTIIVKSTVPAGTNRKLYHFLKQQTSAHVQVVSNPEFLREGTAVSDFLEPDRIVIGGESPEAFRMMRRLYDPIVKREEAFMTMSWESAELTKYAANAMLATRISFMNEMARICEAVGADVNQVRKGIGTDARIGFPFLFAGVGYGGSCFPKDVQAIIRIAKENGLPFPLLNAVEDVNERQKRLLVEKVVQRFGEELRGYRFAIWGLAFKPRTDDMREAPSIVIIDELLRRGARIEAHDPESLNEARKVFADRITYHRLNYDALEGADALLIVTDWNEFRRPDFTRMRQLMKTPLIFDGRNLYDHDVMREQGFAYFPIGRAPIEAR